MLEDLKRVYIGMKGKLLNNFINTWWKKAIKKIHLISTVIKTHNTPDNDIR